MTKLNRAHWTGKMEEAEIYRQWLVGKFSRPFVKSNVVYLDFKQKKNTESVSENEVKLAA